MLLKVSRALASKCNTPNRNTELKIFQRVNTENLKYYVNLVFKASTENSSLTSNSIMF